METGQEILKVLSRQRGHYVAMRDVVEKQTVHIRGFDIGGLTAGASEARGLMRKIRDLEAKFRPLRQSWGARTVDRPASQQDAIELAVTEIKDLIGDIQKTREQNTRMLKKNMAGLKAQMTGLESQTKAAKAYGTKPATKAPAARFIDTSN